jgi:hypothetical protein
MQRKICLREDVIINERTRYAGEEVEIEESAAEGYVYAGRATFVEAESAEDAPGASDSAEAQPKARATKSK